MAIMCLNNILEFKPGVPPDYNGPSLPGAQSFLCDTDSFNLMVQEFRSESYTIRLNRFAFLKPTTFRSTSGRQGLHSRTLLQNNLRHKIRTVGKLQIDEGQSAMLWAEKAECETNFDAREYKTLDIFYSPALAEQLCVFFPELSEVVSSGRNSLLSRQPGFITPPMQDIIRHILECPYDEHTTQFYFDIKVREFLYIMLQNIYRKPASRYVLNSKELSLVVEARDKLLEDLSRKPYTISELSKAVGLNAFKLKAGFRELFGLGVFECLQEKRMEKARELLLNTNKPLKEICTLTGYPRMTNFITAFRKKFGYTPGSLRRNQ